jgi:hypothetical protein
MKSYLMFLFSLVLLVGCNAAPCELEERPYTMPDMPENGRCLGMSAPQGGWITAGEENACDPDEALGNCTIIHPDPGGALDDQGRPVPHNRPVYWVSDSGVGAPSFAEVACNVKSCADIDRAVSAL